MPKNQALSDFWDYRIVRVGPIAQGMDEGILRIHRCFYSSATMERVLGLERMPTVIVGADRKQLLGQVDMILDAIGRGVLRSDEIYD